LRSYRLTDLVVVVYYLHSAIKSPVKLAELELVH